MALTSFVRLAVAVLASSALWMQSAEKHRFTHPVPDNQEAAMKRWMDTFKPGPAHERLAELVGKWDMTTRMWMGGAGSKPSESKGSAEITWLAEGKWLQNKWTSQMMGRPLSGLTLLGYDNFKARYVATMVDSMQTCMNSASGHFDQSGDDLILWGTIDEPMTPEQDKMVKYVYRGYGKDKWTLEVHDMMIGESNTKVIEMAFTRKK